MSKTDINPPRSFSTDGKYTDTLQGYFTYFDTWFPPNTYSGSYPLSKGTEGRRGQSTPGYALAAEKGDLPQNSFTYSKTEITYFNGFLSYERTKESRRKLVGTQPPNFMTIPLLLSISSGRRLNLDNKVKQKVLERVNESSVNLAVALAEGNQSLDMIVSMMTRLSKAYSAARSGNFKQAAAALGVKLRGPGASGRNPFASGQVDAIARGWLELQYGWLPLLSDIQGAVEDYHKQFRERQEYVTFKYKSQVIEQDSFSETTGQWKEFLDVTSRTAQLDTSCIVKMRRTENASLRRLSELGFTNPAMVVWEKVPFSFLIDYLVPIGTYLSQFDATVGWSFQGASITNFYRSTATKTRNYSGASGFTYFNVSGECKQSEITCTRTPLAGIAQLISPIPYVRDDTSVKKILNVLALLQTSKR